ncbi:lipid A deacylase LpxR family protein [uncultured Algimonas sp.]|uniref:lipid A deacylase LpxR family protein n=1 Tax=uncultured Algimonas sp. TaxID=1547920 RepID=UPI00260DC762|nr:lipid A deacylase LpxR family protein [uncultured Algimonas sp.]
MKARAAHTLLAVGLCGLADAAFASPDDRTIVAVAVENDTFANTDKHYTNGFRAGFSPPGDKTPDWMVALGEGSGLFEDGARYRAIFTFGQNMYTPKDIGLEVPDPLDRPYAGWLYGSVGLAGISSDRYGVLEISLGVVGPASLADHTQEFVHDLIGAEDPEGWDFQLKNEPALTLTYQAGRVWLHEERAGLEMSLAPHYGGALGNVFIHANAGATLRIGQGLQNDSGPPRIQPAIQSAGMFGERRQSWFVFAGIEGRAVARNIFLDGNTFRDSTSVDSEPLIADLQVGAVFQRGSWKISYTHIFRTDEFETQDESTSFGAIGLAHAF